MGRRWTARWSVGLQLFLNVNVVNSSFQSWKSDSGFSFETFLKIVVILQSLQNTKAGFVAAVFNKEKLDLGSGLYSGQWARWNKMNIFVQSYPLVQMKLIPNPERTAAKTKSLLCWTVKCWICSNCKPCNVILDSFKAEKCGKKLSEAPSVCAHSTCFCGCWQW